MKRKFFIYFLFSSFLIISIGSQVYSASLFKRLKKSNIAFQVYQKGENETITEISKKFGVNIGAIVSLNRIKHFLDYQKRQILLIPEKSGLYYFSRNRIYRKNYRFPKFWKHKFQGVEVRKTGVKGGEKTSGYGHRRHPITGRYHFHTGIDYATPKNSPLYIDIPSKVVFRGYLGNYGKTLILQTDSYKIILGHLARFNVKKGDLIQGRTLVGLIGSTGISTGYHVHYEMRYRDKHINPIAYFRKERQRVALQSASKKKKANL
jgi:murein DD-endopeptidase MepM/ murein hydrolase activator NlpD